MGCVQSGFLAYGALGTNHAPILHRNKHSLQIDRTRIPYDTCYLRVPSGETKLIFENMVGSMQNMHLSCIMISIISEHTELSFHLSPFT